MGGGGTFSNTVVLLSGQTPSALLYQRLTGLATDSNPCLQLLEHYFLPAIIQVASLDIRNRARTQSLLIHQKYKESFFGPLDFVIQAKNSQKLLLIGCCSETEFVKKLQIPNIKSKGPMAN